jgi:opacity protein-like surface antigen
MPKFVIFTILVFITFNLKAQTWEIGGSLGGSGYMGDLNPNNPIKISGYAIGGFVKRNFNGYLSAKLNANLGRISAADSNSNNQQFRNRNLSFTTDLREISLIGEFNFMHYIPEAGKNKFTPYIFLGIADAQYIPRTIYGGKTYALRGYKTEGEASPYSTTTISYLYGAGIKYNILGKFTLGAELGYRNSNTDYLDDVSGTYANKNTQYTISRALGDRSGEKTGVYSGSAGTQRGDLRPHDTYFFSQITLSYTFVTQKCYFQ